MFIWVGVMQISEYKILWVTKCENELENCMSHFLPSRQIQAKNGFSGLVGPQLKKLLWPTPHEIKICTIYQILGFLTGTQILASLPNLLSTLLTLDGTRETTLRGKWGFPCGLFGSRLAHSWIRCHKFLYFTFNFAMIIIFPSNIFTMILFMSACRFYDPFKWGNVYILVSSFNNSW